MMLAKDCVMLNEAKHLGASRPGGVGREILRKLRMTMGLC
jgi:hypothetical protein